MSAKKKDIIRVGNIVKVTNPDAKETAATLLRHKADYENHVHTSSRPQPAPHTVKSLDLRPLHGAKYPGKCFLCDSPIDEGEECWYSVEQSKLICEECVEGLSA